MKIILFLALFLPSLAFSKNANYVLSKTIELYEENIVSLPHDRYEEYMKNIMKNENDRKSQNKMYTCTIAYKGTPIKIINEIDINNVKIKIRKGFCKGTKAVVKATDIEWRKE